MLLKLVFNLTKVEFIVFNKIISYIREVKEEAMRMTFPAKKDVYATSLNIVMIVLFSVLVIAFADFVVSRIIRIIFGLGN